MISFLLHKTKEYNLKLQFISEFKTRPIEIGFELNSEEKKHVTRMHCNTIMLFI